MKVLVGTTVAAYKLDQHSRSWLLNRRGVEDAASTLGAEVGYFAAVQTDGRGLAHYDRFLRPGEADSWQFSVDYGNSTVLNEDRLASICAGRNLITERAMRGNYTHILFVDTDVELPAAIVPRLAALDYPIVGAHVPTYGRTGPAVDRYPAKWDVQCHWNTAGCLLVERELFRVLRWRWDIYGGLTDDPCYGADAERLGFPTLVRHDTVANHHPPSITSYHLRGHDLGVYR